MKLRYVLISVFFILAMAPIALLVAWPQSPVLKTEVDEVHERHLLLAQNLAAALNRYQRDLQSTFQLFVADIDGMGDHPSTEQILTNLAFRHICVADAQTGAVSGGVARNTSTCPAAYTADELSYFQSFSSPEGVTFGPVVPGDDGANVIHLVSRIGDQIAVGAIETTYFRELGQAVAFGKKGHAAIVDQTGRALSHPLPEWTANRQDMSQISAVQRMLRGETGVEQFYSPALKGDMIAGFTSVQPVGWGVMIPQPMSELQANARKAQLSVIFVLLFGVAIAFSLAIFVSLIVTRPLDWAIKQTNRVSRGDLSLPDEPQIRPFQPVEFTALHQNIYEMMVRLRRSIDSINRLAFLDATTGLGNRSYLQRHLKTLIRGPNRVKQGTLLFIDLDGFKEVNDNFGHDLGDIVLREVAERICNVCKVRLLSDVAGQLADPSALTDPKLVARLGGDEFVAFVVGKSGAQSAMLGQRIVKALHKPINVQERSIQIGASVGIAHYPRDGRSIPELLKAADLAMYNAKSQGKGRTATFSDQLRTDQDNYTTLGSELKNALKTDQLVPYFHPQFQADDFSLAGVEALVRWNHPTRGLLHPKDFLPIAEDLGLVGAIDRMILRQSVLAMTDLIEHGIEIPSLSVNLSSERLASGGLVSDVKALGELPFQLRFELLETIFLDHVDKADLDAIRQLEDMGVLIEMDDFGSGHASMMALLNIRPHTIKIDQRLIRNLPDDPQGMGLVHAIIEMGRSMGIKTTVEGVETREQATILREMGCDKMQGYYFAQPMSVVDLMGYLFDEEIPQVARA